MKGFVLLRAEDAGLVAGGTCPVKSVVFDIAGNPRKKLATSVAAQRNLLPEMSQPH